MEMTLKDRLEFAQNIIEAYEHIRNNGTTEDIKETYNIIEGRDLINHPYVIEKHRKHINFNSFMTNLDYSNKRSYTKLIYLRMVKLKKEGNLTPFKTREEKTNA
tara:strand:+ start:3093 stop:3404 length:312 start_codon:yes stop_codon:yes gene_type:complete